MCERTPEHVQGGLGIGLGVVRSLVSLRTMKATTEAALSKIDSIIKGGPGGRPPSSLRVCRRASG